MRRARPKCPYCGKVLRAGHLCRLKRPPAPRSLTGKPRRVLREDARRIMKGWMCWAHVTLTALVLGKLLDVSSWGRWYAWVAWVGVFLVTAWWEYIVVMSWEYWTAIEV